jgi:hypothetical protein
MQRSSKAEAMHTNPIGVKVRKLVESQMYQFVLVNGSFQKHLTWRETLNLADDLIMCKKVNPNTYIVS